VNRLSHAYLYQCDYLPTIGVTPPSETERRNDPTFLAYIWSCEGEEFLTVARSS